MKIGTVQRLFPRGMVTRAFETMNPGALTLSHPVQKNALGEPVDIRQGMIVSLGADGFTWTRGVPADGTGHTLGFAKRDAKDLDVEAADKLTAMLLRGPFRLLTPYFVRFAATGTVDSPTVGDAYAYTPGTPLTYAAATEIAPMYVMGDGGTWGVIAESAAGYVRPAKTDERIIGRVVGRKDDKAPLGANGNTPAAYLPTGAIIAGRQSWLTAVDSTAHPDGSYFIEFDTDDHGVVMA